MVYPMIGGYELIAYLEGMRDDEQREVLMRFFKTGPGEYGEGDQFLGLRVPQVRQVVKMAADLPLEQVPMLLASQWHEVRLCGLLLLVARFERWAGKRVKDKPEAVAARDEVVQMYLRHATRANNWDLVDLSAPKILGHWLLLPTALGGDPVGEHIDHKMAVLDHLADSGNLWLQRIGMVCTWKPSQQGDPTWCLRYAERHLEHQHDLMHKAVGWMLREVGKRVSADLLRQFLERHIDHMARTTLRYAIELLPHAERQQWLHHRPQP